MLKSASPSAQLISEIQTAITTVHPTMSKEDVLIGVQKVANRMEEHNAALSHVAMQMVIRNLPASIAIFKQNLQIQGDADAIGRSVKADVNGKSETSVSVSDCSDESLSAGSTLSKDRSSSDDSQSSDLDDWEVMCDELSRGGEKPQLTPAISEELLPEKAEAEQFVSMFDGMKSKTASNLRKFKQLSSHGKLVVGKRMNQFVMTVGLPDLPRRHPGVDDSFHPYLDINFKWLNLLELGNNTLKYIHQKENKQCPCPNLLFLRTKLTATGPDKDDADTRDIMKNHMLNDFREQIQKEKQLPIEFHFAGHGTQQSVGTTESISGVGDQIRMEPEDFAEYFDTIVQDAGLSDNLKNSHNGVRFFFHTCNSAFFQHADGRDMDQQILEETIIGRFYQVMKAKGYNNFEVVGFRGFYQAMTNGSGVRFSDSAIESMKTLEVSQQNAEYRISYKRTGQSELTEVQKPTNNKYWTFDLIDCDLSPSASSKAGPSSSSKKRP